VIINREHLLQQLDDPGITWDIIVIGGGATGLGAAVEAASRGYRTLLLEQRDFAAGTSSRSTKLIHGGFRYLRQGNLGLVLKALRERHLLIRNAPHLVHDLRFVVPLYAWWERPFYEIGLKFYDLLAGQLGLGPSQHLSPRETLELIPTLEPAGLRGGIVYHDGQFDDARLAVSLTKTLADLGGMPLNYLAVTGLLKTGERIAGVRAVDLETGREYRLHSKVVVNATGPFTDAVRRMDDSEAPPIIAPSQGAHLVLDRSFLPGESAIMVPRTDDGRVLFAIPWHGRVLVGTTDTPVTDVSPEPRPLPEEIDFLLTHVARYLSRKPAREDVLSVFAGLRPLVRSKTVARTAVISRDHRILVSNSGLVTVTGGKWTTYRRMGEDAADRAAVVAGLEARASVTDRLKIHGWQEVEAADPWDVYGSDAGEVKALAATHPAGDEPLHPHLPYRTCEVVWAVRQEFARTVEDVLARRTRALFLDAAASISMAPRVAELMAAELGRDDGWQRQQVAEFCALAQGYMPP
jgi:glycerol-3-phosphate dehydrogenase